MRQILSGLAGSALDLLFPLECFGCSKEGEVFCAGCLKELPVLREPFCRLCCQPGGQSPCASCRYLPLVVDRIRAPFILEGAVRTAVHRLKYGNLRAAAPQLGRIMGEHLLSLKMPGQLVVPVPMHPGRLRQRGYNQSDLLAKEVARTAGIPLAKRLLTRTQNTPPQVKSQGREQRRANVDGSFRAESDLSGITLILVDDVATTGSTLSACAAALKAAGAASVHALTLAQGSMSGGPGKSSA